MRRRRLPAALSALASTAWPCGAHAQPPPTSSLPPAPGRPATESGHTAFEALGRTIGTDHPDVESAVVVRRGRVLFEHHADGPDTLRDVQSVTKSVLSLAVGAAVGRGAIDSLDRPVAQVLGLADGPDARPAAPPVTFRHLLTMTAGYRPQERFAAATADDPAFLLRRERVGPPGHAFAYDNLSANLLAVALEAATGQSAADFAQQALFAPLGIAAFDWARGRQGHALGFSGLRLRTRDMARLGELVLNDGAWGGVAVVPAAYARDAVAAQTAGGPPVGLAHGYLWWVVPSPGGPRTYFASGWGGQFIWLHRPLDLVIAVTSAVSPEAQRRGQALALIRGELFRAAAAAPP